MHCLILTFFISRGGKINSIRHLRQTLELCYVSCALCWHLIITFVTAPRSYRSHSKAEHKKTHSQTWMPMTHIDKTGTFFDGLIPLQSSKADEISKIQIYLRDLAKQLLGVFNIHQRVRGPKERLVHHAKYDLPNCAVLSTAMSWVCFIVVSLHFTFNVTVIILDNWKS